MVDPLADLNLVVTTFSGHICHPRSVSPKQVDTPTPTVGTFLELTFSVMQNRKLREAVHMLPGS